MNDTFLTGHVVSVRGQTAPLLLLIEVARIDPPRAERCDLGASVPVAGNPPRGIPGASSGPQWSPQRELEAPRARTRGAGLSELAAWDEEVPSAIAPHAHTREAAAFTELPAFDEEIQHRSGGSSRRAIASRTPREIEVGGQ